MDVFNRYVLPSFVERTSYGIKESNPYNKMFEERIIFLGVQIDDASANDVMAQLLTLESADPDRVSCLETKNGCQLDPVVASVFFRLASTRSTRP